MWNRLRFIHADGGTRTAAYPGLRRPVPPSSTSRTRHLQRVPIQAMSRRRASASSTPRVARPGDEEDSRAEVDRPSYDRSVQFIEVQCCRSLPFARCTGCAAGSRAKRVSTFRPAEGNGAILVRSRQGDGARLHCDKTPELREIVVILHVFLSPEVRFADFSHTAVADETGSFCREPRQSSSLCRHHCVLTCGRFVFGWAL